MLDLATACRAGQVDQKDWKKFVASLQEKKTGNVQDLERLIASQGGFIQRGK